MTFHVFSNPQDFPQAHQLITTLNGSVPTTQTLTTTAASNEISKKLPKEILLRILSYLDVVSLCRCAQVSLTKYDDAREGENTLRTTTRLSKIKKLFRNSALDYKNRRWGISGVSLRLATGLFS